MGGGQQGMIAAPVHVPHLLNACPERLAAVARPPRAIYAHRGECGSGDGGGRLGEGGTMATRRWGGLGLCGEGLAAATAQWWRRALLRAREFPLLV